MLNCSALQASGMSGTVLSLGRDFVECIYVETLTTAFLPACLADIDRCPSAGALFLLTGLLRLFVSGTSAMGCKLARTCPKMH